MFDLPIYVAMHTRPEIVEVRDAETSYMCAIEGQLERYANTLQELYFSEGVNWPGIPASVSTLEALIAEEHPEFSPKEKDEAMARVFQILSTR